MKKLFYLCMLLSCALWSCDKNNNPIDPDDPDNPDNPNNQTEVTLEISTTDLVLEARGGERDFYIYCNADWTIENKSDWCTTNVTKGNGDGYVSVSAKAYSGLEDRNTNLTVKAGDKTKVLAVTQKHGDAIVLSKDKLNVPQTGDTVSVEVKSNIEYQVAVPSKFQQWIKQMPESRAVTVKNFSFTVAANDSTYSRSGYIVFSGNSLKDTVHIYQAQKNQLILTEDTYNISSEEKDITVELKTNIDYNVTIQPNDAASWISQVTTRAVRTDKLKFHIKANAGNIVFTKEQDLIDFHAAEYTRITGDITVTGDSIRTLQKLNNLLTEIDGSLILECSSLTTLDGLYGLKTITDSLIIREKKQGWSRSLALTSFEGLQNLETIGGSFKMIVSNSSLTALKSFKELSGLKNIGGKKLTIRHCETLNNINAFGKVEALDEISIIGCSKLYDFCVLKNVVQK